jgi:hypothetical protein
MPKISIVFVFGIKQAPQRIVPKGIVDIRRQATVFEVEDTTFPIIVNVV